MKYFDRPLLRAEEIKDVIFEEEENDFSGLSAHDNSLQSLFVVVLLWPSE